MHNSALDQLDLHVGEAERLIELTTYVAELDEEERARLRPAAVTLLYLLAEKMRLIERAIVTLRT